MTAQRLSALPTRPPHRGPIRVTSGWWSQLRLAGALPRPGAVFLTLVVAAFLLAMLLVLQLQLQAGRVAAVNELERELAQLQRVQSDLRAEAATESDLPDIRTRALQMGLQPAQPSGAYVLPAAGERWAAPSPEWVEPLPPELPDWHQRFWLGLRQLAGHGYESA